MVAKRSEGKEPSADLCEHFKEEFVGSVTNRGCSVLYPIQSVPLLPTPRLDYAHTPMNDPSVSTHQFVSAFSMEHSLLQLQSQFRLKL